MEMMRKLITLVESAEAEIDEAVSIADPIHMAAYSIAVAEAYDAAPVHDPQVTKIWQELARQNEEVFLKKIAASGIQVIYTPDDPYTAYSDEPVMQARYMLWDMVVNHRLLIYTGYSDNHPVFTEKQNIIFRAIHDFFDHGKLLSVFKRQVKKLGLQNVKPTPEQLKTIVPNLDLSHGNVGHSFTVRGEMNAYLTQGKLVSPKVLPAWFTEIVGQACYGAVVGDFPVQKAAFLPGFDYRRIGLTIPGSRADVRMQELMKLLPNRETVATTIAAKPTVQLKPLLHDLAIHGT